MYAQMAATLKGLNEEQARVVWVALAQYVDNTRDSIEYSGNDDAKEVVSLAVAEGLLERMDAAMAALT